MTARDRAPSGRTPDERRDTAGRAPRVVALGGGHGLAATLRALRRLTGDVTAVVGVSDDGGSSGRLRRELGVLPPGDLRMALSALCGDDEWGDTWSRVVQHRFGGSGDLAGHAVGNLLITALWEETGDVVVGLDWVAALLGAHGRVLPVSTVPLEIVADVLGLDHDRPYELREVRGQVAVATTSGDVLRLRIDPADPPACPEALASIAAADALVIGPGSWFTSVLPHFLVPDVAAAVAASRARRVLVLNLAAQPGETSGFAPETHLEVLAEQFPDLLLDVVVADPDHVPDLPALRDACRLVGARLALQAVAQPPGPDGTSALHDPDRLSAAFATVLGAAPESGRIHAWR